MSGRNYNSLNYFTTIPIMNSTMHTFITMIDSFFNRFRNLTKTLKCIIEHE